MIPDVDFDRKTGMSPLGHQPVMKGRVPYYVEYIILTCTMFYSNGEKVPLKRALRVTFSSPNKRSLIISRRLRS